MFVPICSLFLQIFLFPLAAFPPSLHSMTVAATVPLSPVPGVAYLFTTQAASAN
jgi:hypothetical protein